MEELKEKFLNLTFEELKLEIIKEENIKKIQEMLNSLKIKSIRPKIILSSFIIYFYPEDVLDNINENKDEELLFNNARDLINYKNKDNNSLFISKLFIFSINFEKWIQEDKKKYSNNLFHVFHNLTVDKMNSDDDEEKKKQIDVCKNVILECAEKIGGSKLKNDINSHKPVVVSNLDIENEYSNAFWDVIKSDFNNKDYSKIITLLKFIKIFISSNSKNSENKYFFSITTIKDKLENNNCSSDEMIILIDKILDLIEEIDDSEEILNLTASYKNKLWENNDFIEGLHNSIDLIKKILINGLNSS
tara:strand:- start:367 stop:1278 length:912 start_codon:yes stop_codon:yes gene_type:complete